MINRSVQSNVGMTLIGENRKYLKKTFQSVKFVRCLISGLGMNLGLHGERLTTNCLCHSMAKGIMECNHLWEK